MNGHRSSIGYIGSCMCSVRAHVRHDKWQIFSLDRFSCFRVWVYRNGWVSCVENRITINCTQTMNITRRLPTNQLIIIIIVASDIGGISVFDFNFYTEILSKTHTWHCCGPCLVGDVVFGLDFFTVATGTADVATFSLWIFCWFALFTLLLLTLLLLLLLLFVFALMAFRWLMLFITILLVVVVVVVGLLLLMLTFAVRLPLVATVTARAHRHHENSSRDRER